MDKYIFIVGAPRSGTKFLRNTLQKSNNKICIMPETHIFSSIIHNGLIKNIKHLYPFDSENKLLKLEEILKSGEIFGSWWKYNNDLDYSKIIDKFKNTSRNYNDLLSCILEEYKNRNNCKYVGERTPTNIFHVNKLLNWYPKSKILHIIRSPFSVVASEFNMFEKKGYPINKTNILYKPLLFPIILFRWYLIYRLDFVYKKKYPNNYLLIKYNDLYLNSDRILSKVEDFLNIKLNVKKKDDEIINSSFKKLGNNNYNPLESYKNNLSFTYKLLIRLFLYIPLKKMNF